MKLAFSGNSVFLGKDKKCSARNGRFFHQIHKRVCLIISNVTDISHWRCTLSRSSYFRFSFVHAKVKYRAHVFLLLSSRPCKPTNAAMVQEKKRRVFNEGCWLFHYWLVHKWVFSLSTVSVTLFWDSNKLTSECYACACFWAVATGRTNQPGTLYGSWRWAALWASGARKTLSARGTGF